MQNFYLINCILKSFGLQIIVEILYCTLGLICVIKIDTKSKLITFTFSLSSYYSKSSKGEHICRFDKALFFLAKDLELKLRQGQYAESLSKTLYQHLHQSTQLSNEYQRCCLKDWGSFYCCELTGENSNYK